MQSLDLRFTVEGSTFEQLDQRVDATLNAFVGDSTTGIPFVTVEARPLIHGGDGTTLVYQAEVSARWAP